MFKKFADFIEKIRNSEENVKKRWLIFFSAIAMVVVVSLWVLYIDLVVLNIEEENQVAQLEQDKQKKIEPNSKVAGVATTLSAGWEFLKEKFNAKNLIVIESPEKGFLKNEEKVTKTQLP